MDTKIWVCKPDGTIQCQETAEIPLATMRKQLAAIIGADEILNEEKRSHSVPAQCGAPTGNVNAYEITNDGYWLLTHGFVGPMGFRRCEDESAETTSDGELTFGSIISSSRLTSVGRVPVLIRELIGRGARVYRTGDPTTDDFVEGRVNIELNQEQRIVDIWFG